ncbi:hypothetical protein D3C71_774210 [compost metagenome]
MPTQAISSVTSTRARPANIAQRVAKCSSSAKSVMSSTNTTRPKSEVSRTIAALLRPSSSAPSCRPGFSSANDSGKARDAPPPKKNNVSESCQW